LHTFDLVAKSMSAQRPKGDAEIIGYEKIISLLTCLARRLGSPYGEDSVWGLEKVSRSKPVGFYRNQY
jgi:hypothetical protein